MGQEQHHQRYHQADAEVDVERLADFRQGRCLVLLDEQIPLELGQIIHIEDMVVTRARYW